MDACTLTADDARYPARLRERLGDAAPAQLTLNTPSHPIRNRLLRLAADSPDLLAIIKQEGRV